MNFDDIEWEREDDKIIIFHPKKLSFFELNNDVGSDIWELLVKKEHIDKIVDFISEKYAQTKSVVKKDVEEFVKEAEKTFS